MAQAAAYRKCICGNACSYYVAQCDHCQEWYYMSCHNLTEKTIEHLREFYCKPCKRKNRTLQDTRRQHPTDKVATYERRQCDDDNPHAIHTYQGHQEHVRCICRTPCKTSFIQCAGEKCKRWCHTECISYTEAMADFVSKYYCPTCVERDPRLMIAFETPSPPPEQPNVSGSSRNRSASSTRASSQSRPRRASACGRRDTSVTTPTRGGSSSNAHLRDNHDQMFDDEMYTTTTPTEEQEERNESGESDADYNNEVEDDDGGEDEGGANGEPTVSSSSKPRKRKAKRRKAKKGKPSGRDYLPDPHSVDSQECCEEMGLTNVDFAYREDDYESITSARDYNARFRPALQEANPEANYSKLQVVLTAKYREYQTHLAELGRAVPKKTALRRSSRKREASSTRGGRDTSVTTSTQRKNARMFLGAIVRGYRKNRATSPQEASPRGRERRGGCGDSDSPSAPSVVQGDTYDTTTQRGTMSHMENARILLGTNVRGPRKRRLEPSANEVAPYHRDYRGRHHYSGSPCTPTTTTDINAAPIPGSSPLPQHKQEEPQEDRGAGDGMDLTGPGTDAEVAQAHPTAESLINDGGAPTSQVKQEEPDEGTDQALDPTQTRIRQLEEQLRNKDRLLGNAKEGNKRLLEVRKRFEEELAQSKADRKRDAEGFARALSEKESEMAELRRQLAAANHQQPSTSAAGSSDAKLLARIGELENELQLRDAYIARKTLEAQGNKE